MAHRQDCTKTMRQERQNIIESAHALVAATSGELDVQIQSARAAMKECLDSTKGDYGDFEDRLLEQVQVADDYIHVNPYHAIGGTFLTGLFLGWLMSKKSQHEQDIQR